MSNRLSLALDIGTRKVVGLLVRPSAKGFKIIAAERIEHHTRAMFDGQIHDVVEVASVVGRIVQKLSAKAGAPLTEAAVAAAGRALRTFRGTAVRELSGLHEMTHDDVFSLELEAVQSAQGALSAALKDRERPQDYHYVGHSIMGARLDSLPIGNLIGQRGSLAELDVIATFLPRGVVDSLQAVLQRTGLEMTALTLEPIAALSVAVPQSMRHLNLVLVDIGAGTSDIAITSKGSVLAYDMVPIAGDEITEALSEAYLLDFKVGEGVKRQISTHEQIAFADILGQKHTVSREALTESIQPAVMRLAREIAERVLKLNGGPPQAIMLVGGGSLTPGLTTAVATATGLPASRVAVRGREAIAGVEGAKSLLNGPDCITPIGIAVASRDRSTLGFAYVHVNTHGVRLFHPAKLTVADALLASGIAIRDLQGQVGRGMTITVNGALRIVRGTFGKPATLLLNDQPATLETAVAHRDRIAVTLGTPGEDARATVADVAPEAHLSLAVVVDDVAHRLPALITVNGEPAAPDRALTDNDAVVVRPIRTVEDVLLSLGYDDPMRVDVIRFSLEGNMQIVRRPRYQFFINETLAGSEALLRDGDHLTLSSGPPLTVREAVEPVLAGATSLFVKVNGAPLELPGRNVEIFRNGRPAALDDLVSDNDAITIIRSGEGPIFADLLARSGVATYAPPGKSRLVMLLNGRPAEFTTILKDGDAAELTWE